jgi:hypothetical protein
MGQRDWKSVVSMMHSLAPSELFLLLMMVEISERMDDTREGFSRIFTRSQKEVGAVLVVARKRVEISKLEMSSEEHPQLCAHSNLDLTRVLAVR